MEQANKKPLSQNDQTHPLGWMREHLEVGESGIPGVETVEEMNARFEEEDRRKAHSDRIKSIKYGDDASVFEDMSKGVDHAFTRLPDSQRIPLEGRPDKQHKLTMRINNIDAMSRIYSDLSYQEVAERYDELKGHTGANLLGMAGEVDDARLFKGLADWRGGMIKRDETRKKIATELSMRSSDYVLNKRGNVADFINKELPTMDTSEMEKGEVVQAIQRNFKYYQNLVEPNRVRVEKMIDLLKEDNNSTEKGFTPRHPRELDDNERMIPAKAEMEKIRKEVAKLPQDEQEAYIWTFHKMAGYDPGVTEGYFDSNLSSLTRTTNDTYSRAYDTATGAIASLKHDVANKPSALWGRVARVNPIVNKAMDKVGLESTPLKDADRELYDEQRLKTVEREMKSVVSKLDDDAVSWVSEEWERASHGLSGTIGYMATAAIPKAGMAILASDFTRQAYEEIDRYSPDMDETDKERLALTLGVFDALIERLQLKGMTRGFPVTRAILQKMKIKGAIATGAAASVSGAVTESFQEHVQAGSAAVGQHLISMIDPDIDPVAQDRLDKAFSIDPEILRVTMPLGLIGGFGRVGIERLGMVQTQDFLAKSLNMEVGGIDPVVAQDISETSEKEGVYKAQKKLEVYLENTSKEEIEANREKAEKSGKAKELHIQQLEDQAKNGKTQKDRDIAEAGLAWYEYEAINMSQVLETDEGYYKLIYPEDQNKPNDIYESEEEALAAKAAWDAETIALHNGELAKSKENIKAMRLAASHEEAAHEGGEMKITGKNRTVGNAIAEGVASMEKMIERANIVALEHGLEQGMDINQIKKLQILGETKIRQGARGYVAKLYKGANVATVFEEGAEGYIRDLMDNRIITPEFLKFHLKQYQVDSKEVLSQEDRLSVDLDNMTDQEAIEGFSKLARAHIWNNKDSEMLHPKLAKLIDTLRAFFRSVFKTAENLIELKKRGLLDEGFEKHLDRAVGLDQDAILENEKKRYERELLEEASDPDTELQVVIKGKLPRPSDMKKGDAHFGEIKDLYDHFRRESKNSKTKDGKARVVSTKASSLFAPKGSQIKLDEVREALNELGFEFDTPADMLEALDESLRGMKQFPTIDRGADYEQSKGRSFSIGNSRVTATPDTQVFKTAEGGVVGPASFSIGAFHGTPHQVDRFSTENIGTGEGAQAFGWGLYFAESVEVAGLYTNSDDSIEIRLDGQPIFKDGYPKDGITDKEGDIIDAYGSVEDAQKENPDKDYSEYVGRITTNGRGSIYAVELNVEQDELLDWDMPINEQSELIQKALTGKSEADKTGQELYTEIQADQGLRAEWEDYMGGQWVVYNTDGLKLGTDQDMPATASQKEVVQNFLSWQDARNEVQDSARVASESLSKLGIKGIKYLDGSSRADGEGSYNYVIFDDADISITHENGEKVDTGASFSISPAQDAAYMRAVESGDVETQQKMVDDAAEAANYDGDTFIHETSEESSFDVFDVSKDVSEDSSGRAIWVRPEGGETLAGHQRRKGKTKEMRLKIQSLNGISGDYETLGIYKKDWGLGNSFPYLVTSQDVDIMKSKGRDSVILMKGGEVSEIVLFSPSQIKSAEPVTYDSEGNVVPLSQRFDSGRDEISFSIAGPSAVGFEQAKADGRTFEGKDGKERFELDASQAKVDQRALDSVEGGIKEGDEFDTITYKRNKNGRYDLSLRRKDATSTKDILYFSDWRVRDINDLFGADTTIKITSGKGDPSIMDFNEWDGESETDGSFDLKGEFEASESFNALPLRSVLDFPELYKAYPDIAEIPVMVDHDMGGNAWYIKDETGQEVIQIGAYGQKSALLHEIQHAIQEREGFSQGTNLEQAGLLRARTRFLIQEAANLVKRLEDHHGITALEDELFSGDLDDLTLEKLDDAFKKHFESLPVYAQAEIKKARYQLEQRRKDHASSDMEAYRKNAGETEARGVQARMAMTAKDRAENPFMDGWESYSMAMPSNPVAEKIKSLMRDPDKRMAMYKTMQSRLDAVRQGIDQRLIERIMKNEKHNPRHADVLDSLAQLQAIASVLPPEIRGKLKGWRKIASYKTTEGVERYLVDRLDKVEKMFEKHLRKEYIEEIDSLLAKGKPKKGKNQKVAKGNLTPEVHSELHEIEKIVNMSDKDLAEEVNKTQSRISELMVEEAETDEAQEQNEKEILEKEKHLSRLTAYGKMKSKKDPMSSDGLALIYDYLDKMITEGRVDWAIKMLKKKEKRDSMADHVMYEVSGGEGTPNVDSADYKKKTEKEKREVYRTMLKDYHAHNISFEHLVNWISRKSDATAFDSYMNTEFGERVHNATHGEARAVAVATVELEHKIAEIYGIDPNKIGWHGKVIDKMAELAERKDTKFGRHENISRKELKMSRADAEAVANGDTKEVMVDGQPTTLSDKEIEKVKGQLKAHKKASFIKILRVNKKSASPQYLSEDEMMFLTMMYKQEGLRDTMEYHGYDKKLMIQMEAELSDEAKVLRSWLWKKYDGNYDYFNNTFKEIFGLNIPKNKDYAPAKSYHRGKQIKEMIDSDKGKMSTTPGMAIERIQHKAAPRNDVSAIQTYLNHVKETEHFVHWADLVGDLRSVFGRKEVREAIIYHHGKDVYTQIMERIEMFAAGGNANAKVIRQIDMFRSNFTVAKLAYNWGVALKQLTSLPAYMYDIDVMDYAKYQIEFFKNPKENLKFMWNLDYTQERWGSGYDRDVNMVINQMDKQSKLGKVAHAGMKFGQAGDIIPVMVGGYAAYRNGFEKSKERNPNADESVHHERGVAAFEMTTDRAQQSGHLKDQSGYALGGSLARMFTMFTTSPRQYMSNSVGAYIDMNAGRKGSKARFAKHMFISHVVLPSLFHFASVGVGNAFKPDEEDEEYFGKKWVTSMLVGPLSGYFLFGHSLSSFTSGYEYQLPVLEFTKGGKEAAHRAYDKAFGDEEEEEITPRDVIDTLDALATSYSLFRGEGALLYDITKSRLRSFGVDKDDLERLTMDEVDGQVYDLGKVWNKAKKEYAKDKEKPDDRTYLDDRYKYIAEEYQVVKDRYAHVWEEIAEGLKEKNKLPAGVEDLLR